MACVLTFDLSPSSFGANFHGFCGTPAPSCAGGLGPRSQLLAFLVIFEIVEEKGMWYSFLVKKNIKLATPKCIAQYETNTHSQWWVVLATLPTLWWDRPGNNISKSFCFSGGGPLKWVNFVFAIGLVFHCHVEQLHSQGVLFNKLTVTKN